MTPLPKTGLGRPFKTDPAFPLLTAFLALLTLMTLLALAACGGRQVSSVESAEAATAVWSGDEEAMLILMQKVCAQYAAADPLKAPDKGFVLTYFGHFRILAELLPMNPAPVAAGDDEALPPPGPVSGDYGLRVSFDKGLSRYEELVDTVYADLAREFDANFVRR